MNGKVKNSLLVGMVFLVLTAHAQDEGTQTLNQKGFIGKALAAIGTSKMMRQLNDKLCGTWTIDTPHSPATEELKKLAKEAQTAVGIPEERQVPIRISSDPNIDGAYADQDAIYVGNYNYNYGQKRCMIFHEAVHIKYHDKSTTMIPTITGFFGTPILTKMFIKPKGKFKLLYPISMLAGLFSGRFTQKKYLDFAERRADIEGHYATGCHMCVSEHAGELRRILGYLHQGVEFVKKIENPTKDQVEALKIAQNFIESKKRYLSVEENEIIAADLERDGKVCAFHKNEARS